MRSSRRHARDGKAHDGEAHNGEARGLAARLRFGLRVLVRTVLLFALVVGALVVAELVWRQEAEVLAGIPRVVDGDTLEIDDRNIRLAGLDAPERAQRCEDAGGDEFACGRAATDYLRFLIGDEAATCRGQGTDRWQRLIARCRANGVDLSEAMIRRGWAVAFMGDLEGFEADARDAGVGMWAGTFTRPADWRRERRSASLLPGIGSLRDLARDLAVRLRGDVPLRAPADEPTDE